MNRCIDYECGDLENHVLNDCEEERLGGSDQIIILDCDHQLTDPSNGTEVLAEISAGRAVLVQNVKFGMDLPSAVEVASNISGRSDKLVNYDRSATMMDGNVNPDNIDFYNSILNGRSVGGIIFLESGDPEDPKVTWIDAAIRGIGGRIVPNENNEFQRFETTFKWRKKSEPQIYDMPAGVFTI